MSELRTPPTLPRVRASVQVLADGGSRLYLRGGARDREARLPDGTGVWLRLLEQLDGNTPVGDVAQRLGLDERATEQAVGKLDGLGFLEDGAAPPTPGMDADYLERFDRQICALSDLETPDCSRYDLQERLRRLHVMLLGAGSLGSWCGLVLAGIGIGRLSVVDDGAVDGPLGPLFAPRLIGAPRATLVREGLARFRPDLVVDTTPDWSAGFVLWAMDAWDPAQVAACERSCRSAGVARIYIGRAGRIGPLLESDEPGCPLCLDAAGPARPPGGPGDMFLAGLAVCELYKHVVGQPRVVTREAVVEGDVARQELAQRPRRARGDCAVCGRE
jgi:ThiF family